jgi:hypothetical protein
MLIAQQHGFMMWPRLSLYRLRHRRVVLAVFALALLLAPLLRSEEITHDEPHTTLAGFSVISAAVPADTTPAEGAAPTTSPHSHCAIHCSLASLMVPLILLGTLLLATRLGRSFPSGPQRLPSPPLSPPPQRAR